MRIVWQTERPDAVDLHLHPHDVPGALVAVDTMDPPGSWRWGGPAYTGVDVPPTGSGLAGLTVAVPDPVSAARRWAAVAGVEPDGTAVLLDDGRQRIEFVPAAQGRAGLVGIGFGLAGAGRQTSLRIGDTTIEIRPGRKADHG